MKDGIIFAMIWVVLGLISACVATACGMEYSPGNTLEWWSGQFFAMWIFAAIMWLIVVGIVCGCTRG